MSVPLYLNELSLDSKAPSTHEARQRMERLVRVADGLTALGAEAPVRTSVELYGQELAPGYRVADWYRDAETDRELRRLWMGRISSAPRPNQAASEAEVTLGGRAASGLGAAWAHEGIAVSLASKPQWNTYALEVTIRALLDDGTVEETADQVRHASTLQHVERHEDWVRQGRGHPATAQELWQRRAELFPDLLFCEAVRGQLDAMVAGSDLWHAMHRHLYCLQDYARTWQTGPFDPGGLRGKPRAESQSTLNQYSEERTFRCPDGSKAVFSWHVSISRGYRLHFHPDGTRFTITIGYVGKHLRTASGPG